MDDLDNSYSDPWVLAYREMEASPGRAYVKRANRRGSSLNVFLGNARDLIEIDRCIRDPKEGPRLWHVDRREEFSQTQQEVGRLLHNFVAASKTLIDHTRNFVRKNYSGTPIADLYYQRVTSEFAELPVGHFVCDLRNYVVHRDLPASTIFFACQRNKDDPQEWEAPRMGVRYDTGPLLDWDRWTAPAKRYIEDAGEHVTVHVFTQDYVQRVLRFHNWLSEELDRFHREDLVNLQRLEARLGSLG